MSIPLLLTRLYDETESGFSAAREEKEVMRYPKTVVFATLLAVLAAPAFAGDTDMAAAFARLKSLAGTWEAITPDGKTSQVTYEVIANGTAVVERDSHDGTLMETVFHLDGKDLVLEHYCMAGNQPRMRASSYNPLTDELQFEFVSVGNLGNPASGYMHNAKFRFVGDKLFAADWTFYQDGKPKFTETIKSRRVK